MPARQPEFALFGTAGELSGVLDAGANGTPNRSQFLTSNRPDPFRLASGRLRATAVRSMSFLFAARAGILRPARLPKACVIRPAKFKREARWL